MSPGPTQLLLVVALYLLPLLILFLVVRWVLRRLDRAAEKETGDAGASSREILDRRYAEGELSREEYLKIRDDIMKEENVR